MIHHHVLSHIRRNRRFDSFIYPFYEGYSIADIVPSFLQSFGVESTRKTLFKDAMEHPCFKRRFKLLFVVDGFGYTHFIRYHKRYPFLQRLAKTADVYPLTSVFPSTTAAALTTLQTGATPQEHGLPEWLVYFEEFDRIIHTLPFKTPEVTEADSLLKQGGHAKMLYDGTTIYEELRKAHIPSYVFLYHGFVNSTYSQSVHHGSTIIPFVNAEDLFTKVIDCMKKEKGEAYFFLYWGAIDSIAHSFGPDSPEHIQAIADFSKRVLDEFIRKIPRKLAKEVGMIMTADHGHVNIKREDIINLNKYPIIEDSFLTSTKGQRILPTGSPHDVFLFIDPKKSEKIIDFLSDELVGQAEVISAEEAIARGLFGINQPSEKFLRRIGNVVILPYTGYHVWYEFLPNSPFSMQGIHGGLSEEEMIVPLILTELDKLLS